MWCRFFRCCSVIFAVATALGSDLRESAWRAREMIGPDHWAQGLQIEIARGSSRPKTVHALVFELEDRLWYFSDDTGTESLSLYRDHLAEDKADLGPLLRQIDPGFVRYQVLPDESRGAAPVRDRRPLRHGCFIESVAQLRAMVERGQAPDHARLLSFYGMNGAHGGGHTVLYFERQGKRFFYDPSEPAAPVLIPNQVRPDALDVARLAVPTFVSQPPQRAVYFPLRVPLAPVSDRTGLGTMATNAGATDTPTAALLN